MKNSVISTSFDNESIAAIYNPEIDKGLVIRFDKNSLDYFVEWKMMGERDYVLGLEPGNCHPDGRHKMREDGRLKFIKPEETVCYSVSVEMLQGLDAWNSIKNK